MSSAVNPASFIRERMSVTVSAGDGMRLAGEALVASGRPERNWRRGAPGQFERAVAPAN